MRRLVSLFALPLAGGLFLLPAFAQQDVISTAIGGGPNDIPALQSDLSNPTAVALGASGSYYIASCNQNRVYKVNGNGILTVVAGLGTAGYSGDGVTGGAGNALLHCPVGVAVDTTGNVYFSDYYNYVVRKVDTTATITTIAGVAGSCNYSGDGSPATNYHLCYPQGLGLDTTGDLFIADGNNCRIRKLVLATDTISTFAGTGSCGYSGDGGPATSAELNQPAAVAIDSAGDAFIADTNNYRIREVSHTTGDITTIAGTGTYGFSGDAGPATSAEITHVYYGIGVNSAGTKVTFADYNNDRIRQFTVGGTITTIAGSGSGGFCGDGGPPLAACFNLPEGVAVTAAGSVYVTDTNNNRIRLFTTSIINTVAGNGLTVPTLENGVAPQGVVFNYPFSVLEDPSKDIFVADSNNCLVRELVKSSDLVNFFAGTSVCGDTGDGGPAIDAELNRTYGLARDTAGNIYIADTQNCIIREVSTAGVISTFAGTPRSCGYSGDGGPATSAQLSSPYGVYADAKGNIYIADTSNQRIRKVSGGTITTFAGNGVYGFLGDGDPAITAELRNPYGVSGDGAGNVYIADTANCRIREVGAATGVINTVAGDGTCNFSGDGPAIENSLSSPNGVRSDTNGNLFISDTNNQILRWVDLSGNMTTFAGTPDAAGLSGDGGVATSAELYYPSAIDIDASGNFLVADQYNFRIRAITAFAGLSVSNTSLSFGTVPIGSTGTPETVTLSAVGPLTISNILVTGAGYTEYDDCGSSLANGSTCTVAIYFTPTTAGSHTGTLTIEDNGYFGDFTTVSLSGTGSAITVTGGPLNFGNQGVKTTSAPKTVTVTNDGTAAVTFGTITVNDSDFAISSTTCPASGSTLAGKASCTVKVTFTPASTGAKKGALIIKNSDPSSPQFVGLTGTGTSTVSLSPASVTFGTEPVGVTSGLSKITLTNNTGALLTLGNPALSVTGPFAVAHATTCTNGLPIASGGNCLIYLTFTPTAVGFPSGVLSIADNNSTSPQTVALSGTATGVEFTPATVNFGTTNVGTQVSSTVTITNVGGTTVRFTAGSIQGANLADFSTNAGDPPCGGSLVAGGVCTFTMYFRPSKVGVESATYLVYDNSPGTPQSLPLTGTGQ